MFISAGGIQIADIPTLTKHDIREAVWNYLEKNDLANFPRPVKHRIPNFKGAGEAGHRAADLECFRNANTVKVDPDKPQEEVRFLALETRKTLLVPTPRLRHGLFNRVEPPSLSKESLRTCSQSEGVMKYSVPVGLDAAVKVDLIFVGSVAVSKTGKRIGKGEGYADLEYGMMRLMKAVTEHTLVVTTVHDCQVFDEFPSALFGKHDVPVDIIVTPTQVITVTHELPKPDGIYWEILTTEKLKQIPILRILRERELSQGKDVTLAAGVDIYEERSGEYGGGRGGRGRGGRGRGRGARRGGHRYSNESEFLSYDSEDTPRSPNIQVTINVNKRNKIVRRTVEQTTKKDRVGSADPLDIEFSENTGRTPKPRKPKLPITYSVFLGKVPSNCRVRDLKDALQGHDVHPVDILWRGKQGYAFARFTSPLEECDVTLQKLAGLKLVDQPIIVEKAKDKADMKTDTGKIENIVEAKPEDSEKGVRESHQGGIPVESVREPQPQSI